MYPRKRRKSKRNVPIMGFIRRSRTERGVTVTDIPRNAYSLGDQFSMQVNDKMRNPFRRKSKKTEETPKQA